MAEDAGGAQGLDLRAEFPAVATAEWEAAIAQSLRGESYEKRLIWKTDEGIAVRPFYRREDVESLLPGRVGEAWEEAQASVPPPDAIRADFFHEAGATSVQELGFALAEATDTDPPEPLFVFSIGSNYFFEIAKLRAIRAMWAQVRPDRSLRIHARTARANKSVYDPYVNLLRVTTEAMSAAIGGCDSLDVEPFGFDAHLALNVQRILREEAHVDKVSDPAAGSYYVESLTASLAREGWKIHEQIQGEGGWSKAIRSGFVDSALRVSREAKAKAVASRRRTLVGVNQYPDLQQKSRADLSVAPLAGDPFPQVRFAEPFERIRDRTFHHARRSGRFPAVLLLKRGDVKMREARANFCLNFFSCASFDVFEAEDYARGAAAADLIVLCSSDVEYIGFAREVCPKAEAPVLVAGNPKEHIAALQAAGVQGFVHALSNVVDTLSEWQDKLGMPRAEDGLA